MSPDSESGRDFGGKRAGRAMLWLAAIGLLAGLTAMFQLAQTSRGGIDHSVNQSGRSMVAITRDRSGHFFADGQINGVPVVFLVDTGATDVAVGESTARQLGLDFGPQVVVMTAAGPVTAWRTRLDSVSLGGISLTNVRATITRAPMDEVLLGMSFLRHFNLTAEGEQLIIESGEAG